jgi:aspartate 1-decarboxylase
MTQEEAMVHQPVIVLPDESNKIEEIVLGEVS